MFCLFCCESKICAINNSFPVAVSAISQLSFQILTKDHSNQSIHWTQQYAIKDRVVPEPSANDDQPQCKLADLDLQKLLPDSDVHEKFRTDCVILVSRILTIYIPAFLFLKDTVIHHIPHPYSEEQSQKSDTVSVTSLIYSLFTC